MPGKKVPKYGGEKMNGEKIFLRKKTRKAAAKGGDKMHGKGH